MKCRRSIAAAVTGIIGLWFASPAIAWNKPGHMVTGAIAWADLGDLDPALRDRVVADLKTHPYYATTWKAIFDSSGLPAEEEGLLLFMEAARWPDDARNSPDDHPSWHFINTPLVPPGQPGWVSPQDPPDVNILTALRSNQSAFETGSGVARAKALCWLFHLVGDAHQPLHAAKLFSAKFPDGDRGGTRYYVRAYSGGPTVSLHSLWDALLTKSENPRKVRNRAIALRADIPRSSLNELGSEEFSDWVDESFEAAVRDGYRNGAVQGSTDEYLGRTLPSGYTAAASAVASRRARLAGARLADLLRSLYVAP